MAGDKEATDARDPLEGKLLTVPEVAHTLGLSKRTIWKLISEGKSRVVHPTPRKIRITRENPEAFLKALDRAREVLKHFGL